MDKEKAHLSLVVIGHAAAGKCKSSALNGRWVVSKLGLTASG